MDNRNINVDDDVAYNNDDGVMMMSEGVAVVKKSIRLGIK